MSKKLYLRGSLAKQAKGKDYIEINGKTLGDCLENLVTLIPKMQEILFYKTKEGEKALRSNIKVLVNEESAEKEGLSKAVQSRDNIIIKKQTQ